MRRVFAGSLLVVCMAVFLGGFMSLVLNVTETLLLGVEPNSVLGAVVGLCFCVLSVIGATVAVRLWFKS